MPVNIVEQAVTAQSLAEYGAVTAAFRVEQVLEPTLVDGGAGDIGLTAIRVEEPWVKDYDQHEPPIEWANQFDVSSWSMLVASNAQGRVGGAVLAFETRGLEMLENRSDLAVLWDIRVAPGARGTGVGRDLFRAAEASSRRRDCKHLKIETQNINAPACRFYERMGCTLRAIDPHAYPDLPNEVQLIWVKAL